MGGSGFIFNSFILFSGGVGEGGGVERGGTDGHNPLPSSGKLEYLTFSMLNCTYYVFFPNKCVTAYWNTLDLPTMLVINNRC